MDDLISREAAIDEIKALYEWHEIVTEDRAIDHFKRLPSAGSEPLTDEEQRIFLAAMAREEKICEEADRNYMREPYKEPYKDSLMSICKSIKRKVKDALWGI